MGTLLADFLNSRSSRPICDGAAAASSARVPRDSQNAVSEGQRSRRRQRLRIGVKREREIITR